MDLQFVFGNPTKKSKKGKQKKNRRNAVAKRRKGRKRKGTRRSKRAKRNPEKYHIKAKEPAGKTPKGKNRYKVVHKATSKGVMTKGEISKAKAQIRMLKEAARGKPAKIRKKVASAAKAALKKLGQREASRAAVLGEVHALREIAKASTPGTKISAKARNYTKKRKSKKKKHAKRKKSKATKRKSKSSKRKGKGGRRSVVLKRRGSKVTIRANKKRGSAKVIVSKASNPKRGKRKGSKRRKNTSLKKGKSYRYSSLRIKANPLGGNMDKKEIVNLVEHHLGHTLGETGGLVLGGAVFGSVNDLVAKWGPKVPFVGAIAIKALEVPVVGKSLPNLILGMIINRYAKGTLMKNVGSGMVAAAVVGMGVQASQKGLKAMNLSGVDYTLEGYGDEPDFGSLPEGIGQDEADFGGVDYTLDGDDAQMGEIPYGGVDYTMEGYGNDEADFGATPEGLGQGQMG